MAGWCALFWCSHQHQINTSVFQIISLFSMVPSLGCCFIPCIYACRIWSLCRSHCCAFKWRQVLLIFTRYNSTSHIICQFEHMSTFLLLLPSCIKWLYIDKQNVIHQHIIYSKLGLGEVQWEKNLIRNHHGPKGQHHSHNIKCNIWKSHMTNGNITNSFINK